MQTRSTGAVTRSAFRFALPPILLAVAVAATACDGIIAPEPDPPVPGWVEARPFPDIRTLHDVVVLAEDLAIAVGSDGAAISWDGETWSEEDTGVGVELYAVNGNLNSESGEIVVMAVGAEGTVVSRDVDGAWTTVASGTDVILFDIWSRGLDDAFIVGDRGTFLRWSGRELNEIVAMTAESIQIRQVPSPGDPDVLIDEEYFIDDPLRGVAGRGGDQVYAVGSRGLVMRFDGTNWRQENSDTSRPLSSVENTGGTVWATTIDGVLLRRNGDGVWEERPRTPAPISLQGVWTTGGSDVFTVGLAGRVFHYTGEEWETERMSEDTHLRAIDGVVLADATDVTPIERLVIAVGAGGRIMRGPEVLPPETTPDAGP